jgi:geranylgeranylglycerol-phosphate geranylgeranyltransferase
MAPMSKINAYLQLIRPELPISAGICVLLGQIIALGELPPLFTAILGFILGFFLSSSAMIFNDIFDVEVDRINTPEKPLLSGKISVKEANLFGIFTAIIAWVIALIMDPFILFLSLALWGLGFLYNWKLKSLGLAGNLIVSLNVGMTIIIGAISIGKISSSMVWIFAGIAFLFDLAEEIAGDAMDMEGDKQRDSRSLAILYGRKTALTVSGVLFALVFVLSWVPVLLGERNLAYILPIGVMDILIIYFSTRLMRSNDHHEGHRAMRGLYLSAVLGLVAFILSRFVG